MLIAMQILQRVSKGANDCEIGMRSSFKSPNHWKAIRDKKPEGKDIITHRHHRPYHRTKGRKLGSKNLKLFIFMCGKKIPKACLYRTLNLNNKENLNRIKHFIHSVNMKREKLYEGVGINERANFSGHVGKKVWPISEASFDKRTTRNKECFNAETKDRSTKGDRKKPISRMKELLRRVASTKEDKRENCYEQKVLQVRRQGNIGAFSDDEVSESPKISFTWDVKTSSLHSLATSSDKSNGITCRKENWITTDSEFVVLEL